MQRTLTVHLNVSAGEAEICWNSLQSWRQRCTPLLHFPSAMLASVLADSFSFCTTPQTTSSCRSPPPSTPAAAQPTPTPQPTGTCSPHRAMVAREDCVSRLHGSATITETGLCRLPPPIALHKHQTETYPQSSCEKRPIFLFWSFRLRDHRFTTHREAREARPRLYYYLPLASPQLADTSPKGAYTYNKNHNFCNCHPRDTSISPGLEVSSV